MELTVDWFSATCTDRPVREALLFARSILDGGDWIELEHGGYGYSNAVSVLGSGRVFYSPERQSMGVYVSLPSSALGLSGLSFEELGKKFHAAGFRCRRLDLALDDRQGLLEMGRIRAAVESEHLVTRWRKGVIMQGTLKDSGGCTINFGSRSSGSCLRIYDKAAEQHVPGHWIRTELELHDEQAEVGAVELLALNSAAWSSQVAGWIRGKIEFKEGALDSNKSRWEIATWWALFLEFADKARLVIPKELKTVEQVRDWFCRQVGPMAFVLVQVFGWESLLRDVGEASARLRPRHLSLIHGA